MNAIDLLESQHLEVADLFEKIHAAKTPEAKEALFVRLADVLAIHASIEEHHFYPAVRGKRREDLLLDALEEHLVINRILSELLEVEVQDEVFQAKMTALVEAVEHHVREESDLFPKVRRVLDDMELHALGEDMSAEQRELMDDGDTRGHVWRVGQSIAADLGVGPRTLPS